MSPLARRNGPREQALWVRSLVLVSRGTERQPQPPAVCPAPLGAPRWPAQSVSWFTRKEPRLCALKLDEQPLTPRNKSRNGGRYYYRQKLMSGKAARPSGRDLETARLAHPPQKQLVLQPHTTVFLSLHHGSRQCLGTRRCSQNLEVDFPWPTPGSL